MILLSILKFILWLLFGFLGLILFLAALILFFPVRYRIKGDMHNTEVTFDIYVSWLFRTFQLRKSRDINYFKVMGIPVKKSKKKKNDRTTPTDDSETIPEEHKEEHSRMDSVSKASDEASKKSAKKTEVSEDSSDDEKTDKNSMIQKIQAIIDKIKSFINYPDREEIIKHTLICIKKLYYKNKPKKLIIDGEIGFAYPDTTGKVLAAVGIINSFLPLNLTIKGNFEEEILKAHIEINGHLMLWQVLWPLIEYILKKPVWKIVRKVIFKNKTERNEEVYV